MIVLYQSASTPTEKISCTAPTSDRLKEEFGVYHECAIVREWGTEHRQGKDADDWWDGLLYQVPTTLTYGNAMEVSSISLVLQCRMHPYPYQCFWFLKSFWSLLRFADHLSFFFRTKRVRRLSNRNVAVRFAFFHSPYRSKWTCSDVDHTIPIRIIPYPL